MTTARVQVIDYDDKCTREYYVLAVVNGDLPAWNADNECTLCGEHMADPHEPDCEMDN